MPARLLTPAELEGEFGINRKTALSLVRDKVLPAVRVGRKILFDRQQIERFVASGGKGLAGGWRRESRA
jgi:excisionase family DNA binding protein